MVGIFLDVLSDANAKLFGGINFSGGTFTTIIEWGIAILLLIGGLGFVYYYYKNKKNWNKKIEVNEIVGGYFIPTSHDVARVVKIGSGGFQVLNLKKNKTYKLAYGGKVGKNSYKMFVLNDGYWYSGMLSANLKSIDDEKGLIQVVTTHPSMRSQYTALERMIELLHADKQHFWDKWGGMIMSIVFVFVAGIFLWLNYQEFVKATANLSGAIAEIGKLIDKINILQGNNQVSNLIPAK